MAKVAYLLPAEFAIMRGAFVDWPIDCAVKYPQKINTTKSSQCALEMCGGLPFHTRRELKSVEDRLNNMVGRCHKTVQETRVLERPRAEVIGRLESTANVEMYAGARG